MEHQAIGGVPPPFRVVPGVGAPAPAAVQAAPTQLVPRVGWPAHRTVSYTKDLIELLLLLLAVPWLVKRIVGNPRGSSEAAASHHLT